MRLECAYPSGRYHRQTHRLARQAGTNVWLARIKNAINAASAATKGVANLHSSTERNGARTKSGGLQHNIASDVASGLASMARSVAGPLSRISERPTTRKKGLIAPLLEADTVKK